MFETEEGVGSKETVFEHTRSHLATPVQIRQKLTTFVQFCPPPLTPPFFSQAPPPASRVQQGPTLAPQVRAWPGSAGEEQQTLNLLKRTDVTWCVYYALICLMFYLLYKIGIWVSPCFHQNVSIRNVRRGVGISVGLCILISDIFLYTFSVLLGCLSDILN